MEDTNNKKSLLERVTILSYGKNPSVMIEPVDEKPDDYDTGDWVKVVNKRYRNLNKKKSSDKKQNLIQKLKDKRKEERKNIKPWYDEKSWQHKLLKNSYLFEDGTSVLEKYNLIKLGELYKKASDNYKVNGIFNRLMKVVTKEEWMKIKNNVIEDNIIE